MAGDIRKIYADKYMADMNNEVYDCKNPVLLNTLKNHPNDLNVACPAEAAEALGKRLQGLMKKQGSKLTEMMISQAIGEVEDYDDKNCDAMHLRQDKTLEFLMATWAKGDEAAQCLGVDQNTYTSICKSVNKNYAPSAQEHSNDGAQR